MLSEERKIATARLAGVWASEVAERVAGWEGDPSDWVAFVRRMPPAHVVDELTVLFYDLVADTLDSGPLVNIPDSAGVVKWSSEHFTLLLKRVIWTVQLAASPYDVQLDAYSNTPFVHVPAEVLEEFDESCRWVLQGGFLHGILTLDQQTAVAAVDEAITRGLEGHANAFVTLESLRTSAGWQTVRDVAARALTRFGIGG